MRNGRARTSWLVVPWKRRAVTVPAVLATTVAASLTAPVWLAGAAVVDVVRGRLRLPRVRVGLFVLQYALNDSAEILAAPWLWLAAGFGRRWDSAASRRRHERLQAWSLRVLARRAEQLLGLRVEIDDESLAALRPGPVVVVCRHVSLLDASLPSLLYRRLGFRVREVIMAELLADPGLDLLYRRAGSVFIPRDDGAEARAVLERLGRELHGDVAAVIFPEGRLFQADALARQLGRLRDRDPERAQRLACLHHVLAPRSGGLGALLDGARDADVIALAHVGLDDLRGVADLVGSVPAHDAIRVVAWRFPARDIPTDAAGRSRWLDDVWCRIDAWIDEQRAGPQGDVPRAARAVGTPERATTAASS